MRTPTTTRVRVKIRAPRFLFVTVPTGRSPRATLEAATAKAQDHILLHATLSPRSGNPARPRPPTPTRPRSHRPAIP